MWGLDSQVRNATRDSRVHVTVYVHPDVRVDRVTNSEEGLEAGCQASAEFDDPEGGAGNAIGADVPYIWDIARVSSSVVIPRWGGRS
jgi:hypothetical protein